MDKKIKTFVFFDLETTGLFEGTVAPKITEIALIAVARESICNKQNSLPRILHKLVLPVNPQRPIPPKIQHMTKLYNDNMQLLKSFNVQIYELIMFFLHRLIPPICFVAHNGDRFDYPVFLSELKCINKVFDDTILCIDTYKLFKDYFKSGIANNKREIDNLLDDGYNESLSAVLDSVIEEKTVIQNIATSFHRLPCDHQYIDASNNKHDINEKGNADDSNVQNNKEENNQTTPTSQISKQNDIMGRPLKKNNLRRRLEFGCDRTSPVNFKLASIYEYMFNSNFENAHSAEADCLAMLHCVIQIADYFLAWSDNNASPLAFCNGTR